MTKMFLKLIDSERAVSKNVYIKPVIDNVPKWADTLQKSCSKCNL